MQYKPRGQVAKSVEQIIIQQIVLLWHKEWKKWILHNGDNVNRIIYTQIFMTQVGGSTQISFWANQNQNKMQYQFQQHEKMFQLEEMFKKFMEKTNQYIEANNQFMRKTETILQD